MSSGFHRRFPGIRLVSLALVLGGSLAAPAAQVQAASCQFVLGFATLAASLPQQVGSCADNETHNPQNGDALQHTTTGGLLVWRKADNWTAFTDGYRTWVNGPNGLQERLNTERFPWEAPAPPSPSPSAAPAASPSPAAPAPAPGSIAAEIAAIAVPSGFPPMASLAPDAQMGCVHMAEDLREAASHPVQMHVDDQLCPYADAPNWPGFSH